MEEVAFEPNADNSPANSENDVMSNERILIETPSENSDEGLDTADDDIDKMLSELQEFQEELEEKSQSSTTDEPPSPAFIASDPLAQFRFSVTALEDSGEVDLDALLEDLCIMERDINSANSNENDSNDNEIARFPNLKSPISPNVKVSADVRNRLENVQEETKELTPEEQQERIKAEKVRIALEKLRAARIKKLVIKVYNDEDPTSKTIAIDQTWTAWDVCKKMMRKNDAEPDPNWVLVERMPDLRIERLLEDHESVVDVVSTWPWDTNNKLVLNNRREKYALFRNPQIYLLSSDTSMDAAQLAEKSKDILLMEYFKKDAMRLPELDGILYLKEGKKSWKKHYFALRASGVYFNPKGKAKSSRDLVCLIKPEYICVYNGVGIKKKLKTPTDYCFVLKHPQYNSLDSKAIVCLCAEDQSVMQRWMVAIRIAKYGYRMLEDYSETQDEMDKLAFTLDRNRFPKASASFSVNPKAEPEPQPQAAPKDYSLKARAQSERLKQAMAHQAGFPGSASFSVRRARTEPPRKSPAQNIGNLFSDAWKKGTEIKSSEPISPDFRSSGISPSVVTPNTVSPKSFVIEANRAIKTLDDVKEDTREEPEYDPVDLTDFSEEASTLVLEPPPLPRKFSQSNGSKVQQESTVYEEISDTQEHSPERERSSSRNSGQGSSPPLCVSPLSDTTTLPPPPPPVPSTPRPSMTGHCSSSSDTSFGSPSSPPPTLPRPSKVEPLSSPVPIPSSPRACSPPHSPQSEYDFAPPPPPKAKHEITIPTSPQSLLQPQFHSSTDSLPLPPPPEQLSEDDDMPLPPPPADPQGGDIDFPPPPPEVILKEQINASLLRRTQSSKAPPPPPPPKTNRRRLSSRSASIN